MTSKAGIIAEIGTVGYSVLTGDSEFQDLVAASIYDTKLVHFFPQPAMDLFRYKIKGGHGASLKVYLL